MIGIVDYGMGNLRSVEKAFHFMGFEAQIIHERGKVRDCDKIVLPGVGAFCDAIHTLRQYEWDKEIKDFITSGKAFLGICLGMQLLFDVSYENGYYEGLGLLHGEIISLPDTVKAPQIGWNSLDIKQSSPLLKGIGQEPYVYFVHSYYPKTDASIVCATTFYGDELQIAVQSDNIHAFQFHPEKSGDIGLQIIKNFGMLNSIILND